MRVLSEWLVFGGSLRGYLFSAAPTGLLMPGEYIWIDSLIYRSGACHEPAPAYFFTTGKRTSKQHVAYVSSRDW